MDIEIFFLYERTKNERNEMIIYKIKNADETAKLPGCAGNTENCTAEWLSLGVWTGIVYSAITYRPPISSTSPARWDFRMSQADSPGAGTQMVTCGFFGGSGAAAVNVERSVRGDCAHTIPSMAASVVIRSASPSMRQLTSQIVTCTSGIGSPACRVTPFAS